MIKNTGKTAPPPESKAEKRQSVFLLWETLAISAHCSKSQRSYLKFVREFDGDTYAYLFDKVETNISDCISANLII